MFSPLSCWFSEKQFLPFCFSTCLFSLFFLFFLKRERKGSQDSLLPKMGKIFQMEKEWVWPSLDPPPTNRWRFSLILVSRPVFCPIWQGLYLYPFVIYTQFLPAHFNLPALLGFYHFLSPYWSKKPHTHLSLFAGCSLPEGQEKNHIYTVGRDFCCRVFLGNSQCFPGLMITGCNLHEYFLKCGLGKTVKWMIVAYGKGFQTCY